MRLLTPASYAGCRWGEAGSFPCESQHGRIATPNLDQFFGEEGLSFTNAYAGYTVCGPSRTTFFTGRHSGNFLKHGYDGNHLGPGQANTTAQMLQDAGYTTALVGKSAPLMNPDGLGFDMFIGQVDQGACHNMYPTYIDNNSGPNHATQVQGTVQLAKQVQGTVHGRPCVVQLHDRCLPEPRSAVA